MGMSMEEFIEYCKKIYQPFIGEAGIMVGNFMFTSDGSISFQAGNYDKENPSTIWVRLAKNRTPQQMADFLRIVL